MTLTDTLKVRFNGIDDNFIAILIRQNTGRTLGDDELKMIALLARINRSNENVLNVELSTLNKYFLSSGDALSELSNILIREHKALNILTGTESRSVNDQTT